MLIEKIQNLIQPLVVSLFAIGMFISASLAHAQSLDEARQLHADASRTMLEFFSSGDAAKFDEAIALYKKAKSAYASLSANLKPSPAADNMKWLAGVYSQSIDLKLSVYDDYMKTHTAKEAPATRTKKIKAEGKEYLVSKDNQVNADLLAKELKDFKK